MFMRKGARQSAILPGFGWKTEAAGRYLRVHEDRSAASCGQALKKPGARPIARYAEK
jgi:hypothetical protein